MHFPNIYLSLTNTYGLNSLTPYFFIMWLKINHDTRLGHILLKARYHVNLLQIIIIDIIPINC